MKRMSMLAVVAAGVWATVGVGVAFAEEGIPEKIKALETKAAASEKKVATLETKAAASESKIAALEATLKGVTRTEKGVNGKPMIDFSGMNVKIDNGKEEFATNGLGNLFVGYNFQPFGPAEQTGSHNIVLGVNNSFTNTGDIITGELNKGFGYESIIGGALNTDARESGDWGFVVGQLNEINGEEASVTGGQKNRADGRWASVSGGEENHAGHLGSELAEKGGDGAWVGGGEGNTAGGNESSGGPNAGRDSSVSGGEDNTSSGQYASLLGGDTNTASGQGATVSGGLLNAANGEDSSILGSEKQLCETKLCHIP